MITIKLHEMFNTDTLRSRNSAIQVVKNLSNAPSYEHKRIDFRGILFASRSFCNELLTHKETRENTSFVNTNDNVKNMLKRALNKPRVDYVFSMEEMKIEA